MVPIEKVPVGVLHRQALLHASDVAFRGPTSHKGLLFGLFCRCACMKES